MTLESISRSNVIDNHSKEEKVREAILSHNVVRLRELSLLPGGFGNGRKHAWPYLLGCSPSDFTEPMSMSSSLESLSRTDLVPPWRAETPPKPDDSANLIDDSEPVQPHSPSLSYSADLPPHPDEHQVQLDTNRSFVLYPVVSSSTKHRKLLQLDLHDIILGVLRKRPKLRYFQGYHDIITVLFLTLPAEYVLPCAEKISLHRLRDAMGNGLEPLVGQLRVLKRLLRIIDPAYSEVLVKNGHLPYYALSNLLTLFSHDMPTLSLIQHVFDWLLCHEPAASIWLEAVMILAKKDEILKLAQEGDDAMGLIHAALTTLPPLSDQVSDTESLEEKAVSSAENSPAMSERAPSETANCRDIRENNDDSGITSQDDENILKEKTPEDQVDETLLSDSLPVFPGAYKDKKVISIPLCDLLRQASDLLVRFPPSLPELGISQTFGSKSVLHMHGTDPSSSIFPSLRDDEAESYVGDDVMLPISQEEQDEELGVTKEAPKEGVPSKKEKLAKERKRALVRRLISRKQMVLTGVVLVIGVAAAVYGLHPNGRYSGRNGRFMTEGFQWFSASVASLFGAAAKFGTI